MTKTWITSLEPYALSLLRVIVGFLFSLHGFQKVFGAFGGMGGTGATAPFLTVPWIAGFMEAFGGLLIIVGFLTRPVAFLLSGEMAVAYFTAHAVRGFWPILNAGELAALYCFVFLYFAAAGPGPVSVDRVIQRRRSL